MVYMSERISVAHLTKGIKEFVEFDLPLAKVVFYKNNIIFFAHSVPALTIRNRLLELDQGNPHNNLIDSPNFNFNVCRVNHPEDCPFKVYASFGRIVIDGIRLFDYIESLFPTFKELSKIPTIMEYLLPFSITSQKEKIFV